MNLVEQLRSISQAITEDVLFPVPDGEMADSDPFVDAALEAIETGGTASATELAALLYYIADMME